MPEMGYMQIITRFIAKSIVHLHYTASNVRIRKYRVIHEPHPPCPPVKKPGDVSPVPSGGRLWLKHSLVNSNFLLKPTIWIWMRVCSYNVQSIHRLQQISIKIVAIALYHWYEIPPPKKKIGHGAAAPLLDRDRRPCLTLEIHPKVMTILYRIRTYHHNQKFALHVFLSKETAYTSVETVYSLRTRLWLHLNTNYSQAVWCLWTMLLKKASRNYTTQWTTKKRGSLFLTITLANLNRFL